MNYELKELSWSDVKDLSKNICDQITEDKLKIDVVVPVLKGGFFLAMMAMKYLNIDSIGCIQIRRSKSNLPNCDFHEPVFLGVTNIEKIKGANVLVTEDIIYSGETIKFVVTKLKEYGAKNIYISTLYNFYKANDISKIYQGNKNDGVNWIVFPWDFEHPFK